MYFSTFAISMLAATGAIAHPPAYRDSQGGDVVIKYVTEYVTEYDSQPTPAPPAPEYKGKHHKWSWKPEEPVQLAQPPQPEEPTPKPSPKPSPKPAPKPAPDPEAPKSEAPKAEAPASESNSGNLNADEKGALDAHNAARGAVGNGDLVWDDELAAGALEYAKQLVGIGSLVHSGAEGLGENLYQGGEGEETPLTNAVNMFNTEKKDYNGDAITENNFHGVGHYSEYPSTLAWPKGHRH